MKGQKKNRSKGAKRAPEVSRETAVARVGWELSPWQRAVLLLLLVALAAVWLASLGQRDPQINFLPRAGPAEWILFPRAMEASAHRIASLDTVFRREFDLSGRPRSAQVEVRAAKRVELLINGLAVVVTGNWKTSSHAEVATYLRAGQNKIEARVFNDNAPAALWLSLAADESTVQSDASWEASCAGSAWRPAALATVPRFPGVGNPLSGGETVLAALRAVWWRWLILAALAVALAFAAPRWLSIESRRGLTILLLSLAGLWLLLFANNARLMPFLHGFDSQDHLNYIKYVQERHALPLPNEGFEMFQPPLYYLVSAGALSLCGLTADAPAAIIVLRFLTFVFGAAQFALVFFCLRLLLPGRGAAQLVGLGLAAFLPMQLYLSHYVTNETLAATLATACVYLALRLLQTPSPTLSQFAGLGLCLGAAMLTKATALLVVGPIVLALLLQLVRRRALLARFGVLAAVFAASCGWHYLRIWRAFGTPVVGNWDAAAGFPWWQDPGFHNAVDYFRFGRALVAPLFSGLGNFADGIYSTLWGDALCGGVPALTFRPPWNYNLMVAGYLLALVPSALILVGACAVFARFVRKASAELLVLFGLSGAIALGLIFMTLKVPSYAQVKAFYGLAALVPLCFFGATGWEVLTRGNRMLQSVLGAFLVFCALNSFASYWVVHSTAQRVYESTRLGLEGKLEPALAQGAAAIQSNPADATAERLVASLLNDAGRASEALPHAQRAVELAPRDGAGHLQLAMVLARQGETEPALAETRRALELAPEDPAAHNFLLATLTSASRSAEVIEAARDGLALFPFSFEIHHALGLALARRQQYSEAVEQLAYAFVLRPDFSAARANLRVALRLLGQAPDAAQHIQEMAVRAGDVPVILNELAWFYATQPDAALRNPAEAVRLAERAAGLTNRADPMILATLAAAYAEAGRIPEAIDLARDAGERARAAGDAEVVSLTARMLAAFQDQRPYHE